MNVVNVEWPAKTREIQNHHMDSRSWTGFPYRKGDIVIATYPKSGTTWTQQIVGQMLFNGEADINVQELSPWVDQRMPGRTATHKWVESIEHRRFLKSHLPAHGIEYSADAFYLYVARDGRDTAWSLHNHHYRANDLYYEVVNDAPRRVGPPFPKPPEDPKEYFLTWLEKDGYPWWPFWDTVRSWWNVRDLPNVRLVHYNNFKTDLEGEMRALAEFLEIEVDADRWGDAVKHCTFEWMKQNSDNSAPAYGHVFEGGSKSFINKGTNNRWRDVLTEEEVARYEQTAIDELGPECAAWLATGEMPT